MAAIIFDFDGTIVDSFDYVADFLARKSNKAPLNDEIKQLLREMSMVSMARRLGFRWWRLPRLLLQGRREMRDVINQMSPFKGVPELIEKLHAEGHELFLISSNSVRNIHSFLEHHNLHKFFLEIYGGIGLFSKAPALRRLLKEQKLETEGSVYIGDEVRDVEAAQSVGLKVIAVSWGFASQPSLKAHKPTAIVETPTELMDAIDSL